MCVSGTLVEYVSHFYGGAGPNGLISVELVTICNLLSTTLMWFKGRHPWKCLAMVHAHNHVSFRS